MSHREFISAKEWASRHRISERTARNYCAHGRIEGAHRVGKTWNVPADAPRPYRRKKVEVSPLLRKLREEKSSGLKGGIYHRIQIDLTYNSNHIEGSRLTHNQTRFIYDTNTIGVNDSAVNVDDIIETTNHFRAIDYIIDNTEEKLTERMMRHMHFLLKSGTSDERKDWFNVGAYKQLPNEVAGMDTTPPEEVERAMAGLITHYNSIPHPSFEDILDFHKKFEIIHPFQDGNGRVGRLVMFRECLRNNIVPFIITDELKMFYYNGLSHWPEIKGYLRDTCLTAQDEFKRLLVKFRIPFDD